MKTKKISWQAIAIVVLALVLIASIALGVSGAWFQDKDDATSTAKMGEAVLVHLADTSDVGVKTFEKNYSDVKAFPGDTILGAVKIVPGTTTPTVIKVSIDTSIKDKDSRDVTETAPSDYTLDYAYDGDSFAADWETSYNAIKGIMDTATLTGSSWATGSDGNWYCFIQSTDDINLFDALKIPTTVNNAAAEWTLEVTIKVEAIQAANLSENTDWYSSLPQATKTLVDTYNTGRLPATE